jgi:hypothetical protein
MKSFLQYLREYADPIVLPWEEYKFPDNSTDDTEPVTGDNRTPPPDPYAPNAQGRRPIAGSVKTPPDPSEQDTEDGYKGVKVDRKGNPYSPIYNNPDNPAVPPPGQNVWNHTDQFNAKRFLERPDEGKTIMDRRDANGNFIGIQVNPSRREKYNQTNPRSQPQRYPHETGDEYRDRLNRGASIYNPNPAPGDAPDKFDYEGIGVSDEATARWRRSEEYQKQMEKDLKNPPPPPPPPRPASNLA